jgi:hypothetical protein
MIQKLKKHLFIAMAAAAMLLPGLVPALGGVASADIKSSLCQGVNSATGETDKGSTCATSRDTGNGLSGIATKVVNTFSLIVGIVAVIMIIYGGFRYITSGGDSGSVGNAKNTLIYAIVGLIIVALAQVIVHFVLNTVADVG